MLEGLRETPDSDPSTLGRPDHPARRTPADPQSRHSATSSARHSPMPSPSQHPELDGPLRSSFGLHLVRRRRTPAGRTCNPGEVRAASPRPGRKSGTGRWTRRNSPNG